MRINVVSLLASGLHMYVCALVSMHVAGCVWRALATAIARKQALLTTAFRSLRAVHVSAPALLLACLPYFLEIFVVACRIKVENFYCRNYAYRLPNIVSKYYFDGTVYSQTTEKE